MGSFVKIYTYIYTYIYYIYIYIYIYIYTRHILARLYFFFTQLYLQCYKLPIEACKISSNKVIT